jgi:hypothetical protein
MKYVGTFVIYFQTLFHMPSSNIALVRIINIKQKAKCRFREAAKLF